VLVRRGRELVGAAGGAEEKEGEGEQEHFSDELHGKVSLDVIVRLR
jgi:hypothetical protein